MIPALEPSPRVPTLDTSAASGTEVADSILALTRAEPRWKVCVLVAGRAAYYDIFHRILNGGATVSASNIPGEMGPVHYVRDKPHGGVLILDFYAYSMGVDLGFVDVGIVAGPKGIPPDRWLQATARFDRVNARTRLIHRIVVGEEPA